MKQADNIAKTDGNVFNEVPYGNAVHGGWGIPGKPKAHRKYIAGGMILSSLAVLLIIANKK